MRFAVFVYAFLQLTVLAYCLGPSLTDVDEQFRRRHKTKEDKVELRKAAQRLLGLRHLPSESRKSRDFDIKMAPKYMLDLYEKYKDGRFRSGKQVANTVRSIQAEVGVINTRSMFVFNLSSIFTSEKILKAEVHLYKRHVRRAKDSDIYMEMNELGPTFLRKLDHRRIPEAAQGWQAADVTTAVEACLDHGDGLPRMMALAFLTPTDGVGSDGLTRMNARWLVRRISRPYLIVYSNDTQNISVDHIQPHINPSELSSTYVEPSTGLLRRFNIADHDREERGDIQEENDYLAKVSESGLTEIGELLPEPPAEQEIKGKKHKWRHHQKNKQHNEVHVTKHRPRRSVLDNEIPEDPAEEVSPEVSLPQTNPGILLSRQQLRRKLSRHDDDNGKLIPYPEGYKRQRRKQRRRQRRKHRKNRGDKQRHRAGTAPGPFKEQWDLEGFLIANQVSGLCKKRTLSVDFADIGWSDWIISPRSFEANYCSGSCPFPLAQRLKPSNHATIQSLVHAIGINSQVPGPCCVPDKLSAVTLLYFDENKNVVLKNYPEMSVDSCSCR